MVPSASAPSFAQRFKASLRNLCKISSPVFLEDGTPVVQAPASVLLKTADQWKGHIVARFHGLIPPPAKIYSDLNPAWGKFGNIVIRTVSDTSCLIMIPCTSTRDWVLRVRYWQAGNCAFSVYPWSEEGSFDLQELETAPTWAVLKNVPPQMYSLDGISVIASAIGEPLHTEKSRLDPFHFGDTKVKVEISLDAAPPTTIIVKDTQQNSVKVHVSYPRLPPKCCNCGTFGHLLNRCPKPLMKKKHDCEGPGGFVAQGTAVAKTVISLVDGKESTPVGITTGALCETHNINLIKASQVIEGPQKQGDTRNRIRVRGRSSPPKDEINRHQRDPLMSAKTQEAVQDWIRESKNKPSTKAVSKVAPGIASSSEPEVAWTVVRSKKENKRITMSEEVKAHSPAFDKSRKGKGKGKEVTQAMYSAKKLASYAASKSNLKNMGNVPSESKDDQAKVFIPSSVPICEHANRGGTSIVSATL